MALFKCHEDSHEHSLKTLTLLQEYDSFLDNIQVVADMGCGVGLDSKWWATLSTRDDPPELHNYQVFAVDKDLSILDPEVRALKNVVAIEGNFEERVISRQVDLMWAHNSLQYSRNPLACLSMWKQTMNVNGMLVLAVPQSTYMYNNRLQVVSHSGQFFSYNLMNLTYMLAVSGFDTRDAYFYREPNSPWLYAAVYASEHEPISSDATWYDLAERQLVSDRIIASVNKYGYAKLDDVVVSWLDKNNYLIKD